MPKKYAVKESFYTLQGEGFHSGRPAVFLRFSGCNLWSGLEKDRTTAICKFCDTDFWGTDGINGGKYELQNLISMVTSLWPEESFSAKKFIVCTGGEPMLQIDLELISALHQANFEIALETNGTLAVPEEIDWICVSPKGGSQIIQRSGHELKLVHPQNGVDPTEFEDWDFNHFYLQPMDGPLLEKNTAICLEYCMKNPRWKLSIQTHKILNIQ
ncbi:MAG: 7-carboxy-7-deazaguanine synthase [Saprospirales bacterium]|nr:MAG: 7-carboxy-7-deazaguanine synthase [Saprospirales bacterium]